MFQGYGDSGNVKSRLYKTELHVVGVHKFSPTVAVYCDVGWIPGGIG